MTLYAYRPGDDACTRFATTDPVIAAGLYADENGPGLVHVLAGNVIETYDVSGECDVWYAEHVEVTASPGGWLVISNGFCRWSVAAGFHAVYLTVHFHAGAVTLSAGDRPLLTATTRDAALALARMCLTAEAEAVLRLATEGAFGCAG